MATNKLTLIPTVGTITLFDTDPSKPLALHDSRTEFVIDEPAQKFIRLLHDQIQNHAYDVTLKFSLGSGAAELVDVYVGEWAKKDLGGASQIEGKKWVGPAGLTTLVDLVAHGAGERPQISAGQSPDSFASRVSRSGNAALGL
jgi:hypothetical protein